MAAVVTEEMRRAYERDGFVVDRQLLPSAQTSELREAVLAICRNETPHVFMYRHPKTRSAVRGAVSLVLATQEHDIAMLSQGQARGGTIVYNGAPVTRTWVEAVKKMGGSAAAMYFGEGA